MAFDVATPVYEGPFDLLLHLILREQVDIYEVSLGRIVDAYLGEIERLQSLDLDVATEFLLIASTLVELKARRLLPGRDDIDLDDELALWEERDLLLARLLECKTFKDVADGVRPPRRRRRPLASRARPAPTSASPSWCPTCWTASRRAAALARTCVRSRRRPVPRVDLFHVAPVRVSVADAVEELLDELPRVGRISFRRLTSGLVERLEVIVRFLALLELFKQGVVELDQTERFGDIEIIWTGGATTVRDGALRDRRLRRMSDAGDRPTTSGSTPMDDSSDDARRAPTSQLDAPTPRAAGRCRTPTSVRAIEAIVLVAVEPVPAGACSPSCSSMPVVVIERLCARARRRATTRPVTASSSSRSPAATATRPTPTCRRTSSASCSTASGRG